MSSEKIRKTALKSLLSMVFVLCVFSCYRPLDDYSVTSTVGEYDSLPYKTPQLPPVGRPPYGRQYPAPYQNQQQPYYYGVPNSRAYYNPYDFQQPYGRNPYSDYDQYYVPPAQYYNNENYNQPDDSVQSTFSGKS